MGLDLSTESSGGVPVEYHRIVSITQVVNEQTVIEVRSYVSQAKREQEGEGDVYNDTRYFAVPYADGITVSGAYDALKTLDEFSGASDVFEAGQEVA